MKKIPKKLDKYKELFNKNKITYDYIYESLQGCFVYMKNANTHNLRKKLANKIEKYFPHEVSYIEVNRLIKYSKIKIYTY